MKIVSIFKLNPERMSSAVTDGPFTESKEIIGGFAVLNVANREDAIAVTRRFLDVAGNGVSELIEVTEP